MTSDPGLIAGSGGEDAFGVQMRGYSRRQVDAFAAQSRGQIRDLEERLSGSLAELERLRADLSAARQALRDKPAHEQVSERVGQILKLAGGEATAQRARAQDEIATLRDQATKQADRVRAEAREQADRMVAAAKEQADKAITAAQAEADKIRTPARADTDRAVTEAATQAQSTLTAAKSQAKRMLDEATARASAIHDGADNRLGLLTSRHTETTARLTEIRDAVTGLVASYTARGSLDDQAATPAATAPAEDTPAPAPRTSPAASATPADPAAPAAPAAQPGNHPPARKAARN